MIDPTAASGATPQSAAQSSLSKLGSDYQSFLKLLTAQISNQDPLKPIDSTTFVTQLAQLTQVEQSVAVNTNLEGLSSQLASVSALSGLEMIGRTVVAPSDGTTLANGSAQTGYRLGQAANVVTMTIRDGSGTIQRVLKELPVTAGRLHQVQWDGRDMDGKALEEGTYSITVEALDAEGGPVPAQTYARSPVERLSFADGMATLHLSNGDSVLAGLVEEVE